MNKNSVFVICLMVLLCICVAGCGPLASFHVTSNSQAMRYVDSHDGVQVGVPENPKRILALSSAFDTILLGLIEPERLFARGKARKVGKTSVEFVSFGENHSLETGSRYSARLYIG